MGIENKGEGIKSVFDLRELTDTEFEAAVEAIGGKEKVGDTYAVLLKNGKFLFLEGQWSAQCSSVTEDMVACGYLGTGEEKE